MKKSLLGLVAIGVLVAFLCGWSATAQSAPLAPAAALFQQALQSDAMGNAPHRERLLAEALRVDPNFELVRWYRGQVHYNGQWKSVDAVSRLVGSDPRWGEYQRRVAETDGSPTAHAELARWCRSQQLTYEQRWHWWNVLVADPQNREALGSLGLRPYRGMLLTEDQIAEAEQEEKHAERDLKHYAAQFQQSLRTAVRSGPAAQRETVKEIALLRDQSAIPAMMENLFDNPQTDKLLQSKLGPEQGTRFLGELRQAVVAALSEMKQHEATLTLLELAVDWPEQAIRVSAAQALRYRNKTDYMPYLMAELSEPVELATSISVLPNGKVTLHEDLSEAGPLAKHEHSQSTAYLTQYQRIVTRDIPGTSDSPRLGANLRSATISRRWTDRARDYGNAVTQAVNTQEQIAAENAAREEHNQRVQETLQVATGEELGLSVREWWTTWAQYNELETPEELPRYRSDEVVDYSRYYSHELRYLPPGRTMSCFAAGTLVWTQAGPVAIETVRAGDLVLSQDPTTGELDYRPVTLTTLRPPSPCVNLNVGGESIVATRGHRFWLVDKGWEMAKFLKPGERVWAISGSQHLDSAEPSVEIEAYNLEVAQFHTYFVGKHQLLVHDNTCPQPVTARLPGVE